MVYFLLPTVLVILDGFGYSKEQASNAIALASMPHYQSLLATYPHTLLQAAGAAVGLQDGAPGNSEVGHLTIGSGRITAHDVTMLDSAVHSGEFFNNPVLKKNLATLAHNSGRLHLIGLCSDGGVHSKQAHLNAFLQAAKHAGIKETYIHAILDGRDVAPQSAQRFLNDLQETMQKNTYGVLGSLHGRFYAMDRDTNWQRTQATYDVLTEQQEVRFGTWQEALSFYYAQDIFDEFIPPTQLHADSVIKDLDGIIFFNYRPDRARQLTQAFVDPHFTAFKRSLISLSFFMTPVAYDGAKLKTAVLYQKEHLNNTLMDVLERAGKSIFAIAETEKYAHVTYFFNGGNEKVHRKETRILIPSIAAKNYTQIPEMSAPAITQTVLNSLENDPHDFYVINYANADMVGHSGNLAATIQAVECLDVQLGLLYERVVKKMNGTLYITADHGNAEEMFDPIANQVKTSHTNNPVIFLMVQQGLAHKKLPCSGMNGLSDVAPCILRTMKIDVPQEMKK